MTQLQMQMHQVVQLLLIKHQEEIAEERDGPSRVHRSINWFYITWNS